MSLREGFRAAFGREPDGAVRAPGRVNLIGEHTDYNDGFVLPCALGAETRVAWARRADARVEVVALDYAGERDGFALDGIGHHPAGGWRDYVRAMAATMAGDGLRLAGADLAVAGDVPRGAGLSSSASLEVALGHALSAAAGLRVDAAEVAVRAQRAENEFVGMRCGVMDQLASAAGVEGAALLIDCRSLETRAVPMPAGAAVLVIQSGVVRGLVEGHYNQRRAECEEAARRLGVASLRDADPDMVAVAGLPPVVSARARHVVSENARVLAAVRALEAGDLAGLGALMAESHASMRDDFAITVPAVDALADAAQGAVADVAGGRGGARMTGGGFGGAVVAVVPADAADAVAQEVRRRYRTPAGGVPDVMLARPAAGAGTLDLGDGA